MIEHPERIKPFHLRVRALLPVDPPEVDAICLVRMMQLREVVLDERPVREIKRSGHPIRDRRPSRPPSPRRLPQTHAHRPPGAS